MSKTKMVKRWTFSNQKLPKLLLIINVDQNSPDSLAVMKILGPVITTDTIAKINLALYIES